jgi:hypothetical protein
MSINKYILSFAFILSLASCKKVLEVEPEFTLDGSNRFKTLDDYQASLQGTYALFHNANYYGGTDAATNAFVTMPDLLSDNVFESDESLGNERTFSRWTYAEDNSQIENTWQAAYRIIAQANLTLKGIDRFSGDQAGSVNRIKAQALTIRAMVHFDVLRYWVDNYDRNSNSPGIPYIKEFNYEQKPSRGTVKLTYDQIEADLKDAATLMTQMDRPINSGSRAYLDPVGVNAILARMYLYANELDSAIKYSSLVINARPLAGIGTFPSIWTDASNAEVVWSNIFEAGEGNVGYHLYFVSVDAAQYHPSAALLATYDQAMDVRYDSYFQNIGGRVVVTKYYAKEAQQGNPDGVVNFKAFRTGEMYLIRAEAHARKGAHALGLADLNTLRAARIAGFVPGTETGAVLIDAIALERRKELFAEGHRFFDLKRTTRTVTRTNCSSFCTLPSSSRSWTWPIPQPEIDANPNMLPQNPGY